MSRAKGEGRSKSEKSQRYVVPAHVRKAEKARLAREEQEWAERSGPVDVGVVACLCGHERERHLDHRGEPVCCAECGCLAFTPPRRGQ